MIVTDEQKEARLAICKSCEHYTKVYICSECGCVMPLKTTFKASFCPLDKWGAITDEDKPEET